MNQIVENIKTYVQGHLQEPMTLHDIADAVGYSKYHVCRRFKEEVGISLFDYIRRKRLTASAHALRGRHRRVVDVAFDFMFDSHEGFTRAFTNGFGIAPKRFSEYPDADGWLIPYYYLNRGTNHTEEHTMEQKTAVIFTQIVERPARKLLLRRSKSADHYFAYCEEFGCGENDNSVPWDILSEIKEACGEPMGIWLPDNMRPEGTGSYAHVVELPMDYAGEIPDGFECIDLDACLYLIFQGEPYDDTHFDEAIGALWNRIAAFDPTIYGYAWDDAAAPRFQLAPMGWRGYIEGRPVRKMS